MLSDVTGWRRLIDEYGRLRVLDGCTAQSRGRRFNGVIAEFLRCWGIDAMESVRTTGEVDVAFAVDGVRYVLEAKWEKDKTGTGDIAKLQKRVRQRLAGTYGVFLAMSGYSAAGLADVADGERLEVLLLDAEHWEAMLAGLVPPNELMNLVPNRAAFYGAPYTPLLQLLSGPAEPPTISFGPPPDAMPEGVLLSAAEGVDARVILSVLESNQLGIACRGRGRLLLTTAQGIVDVDVACRSVDTAVAIRNCHRNPVVHTDGSIMFTYRYGVGRFHEGKLSAIGGGVVGSSCLTVAADSTVWVFDNGPPNSPDTVAVSQLGERLGEQKWFSIDYPAASAFASAWISARELLTIGNPEFRTTSIPGFTQIRHRAPQSNPMGLVHIGDGIVLTAGDNVTLCRTDVRMGHSHQLARLAVNASVTELALGEDGTVYLAAYYQTPGNTMSFVIIEIDLPDHLEAFDYANRAASGDHLEHSRPQKAVEVTSKYAPLTNFLREQPTNERTVRITFRQLERIIGVALPPSARRDRTWWGNTTNRSRVQAHAWLSAGWTVSTIDLAQDVVAFIRS